MNLGKLSNDYTSLASDHYGPAVATYNGLTTIACFRCGWIHLSPLPSPQDTESFYRSPDGFYRGKEADFRIDGDHYRQGLWDSAHRYEAGILQKYGGPVIHLIDLGAGTGWFVKWWDNIHGRAVGVEPSTVARNNGPVPYLLQPSLKSISGFGRRQPIYLRARLVLEHLPDPVGFLKEVLEARPQTTAILVIVPNEFNPLQTRIIKRDGAGHWFIDKTHCNYFTRQGLTNCLRAAGLEPVYWGATFPMELFQLWGGQKYIGDAKVGQRVHLMRLQFEKVFGGLAWKMYKILFDRSGWGREIICVAKLKDAS